MSRDQSFVPPGPSSTPARVIVAGGGVAAVETLLALRRLAGERVETTIVAPPAHASRPTPWRSPGCSREGTCSRRARRSRGRGVPDSVAEIDPAAHRIRCASGDELGYDHLVLASAGGRAQHGHTASSSARTPRRRALHGLLDEVDRGYVAEVAFVVPGCGAVWPLPLYELAIMAARQAWSMGMDHVRFALVTPEERPLAVFGRVPSHAIGELLDGCGADAAVPVPASLAGRGRRPRRSVSAARPR